MFNFLKQFENTRGKKVDRLVELKWWQKEERVIPSGIQKFWTYYHVNGPAEVYLGINLNTDSHSLIAPLVL